MSLNIGVAGSGFITSFKHLPAFARLRHLGRVVALADPDSSLVAETASRFGIPRFYTDVEEMLAAEKLDVLDVCTPPRMHASIAKQGLQAGCHVLLEKPMAVTVQECDEIIDLARASGRHVCVAHSDLFYPPFLKARRLVKEGAIGTFRGMRIFLSTATSYLTEHRDHWAHQLPGGVIGESGPHAVYLTLAFINPIREARVLGSKILPYEWSRFDDYRVDLVGDQGVSSMALVYTSDQWAAEVDIWGSEGLLKLDLQLMTVTRQHRPSAPKEPPAKKVLAASGVRSSMTVLKDVVKTSGLAAAGRYRNTHDLLIEGFLESIRRDLPPPVTGEEGREAVRTMNLIVEQLDALPDETSAVANPPR